MANTHTVSSVSTVGTDPAAGRAIQDPSSDKLFAKLDRLLATQAFLDPTDEDNFELFALLQSNIDATRLQIQHF